MLEESPASSWLSAEVSGLVPVLGMPYSAGTSIQWVRPAPVIRSRALVSVGRSGWAVRAAGGASVNRETSAGGVVSSSFSGSRYSWLTYYGGNFSTSQKRGAFTDRALETLPADFWRYFLIPNAPESDDSSFTWEHFAATVNKDLADTLGNFVNRVLSFSQKRFGNQVPAGHAASEAEAQLGEEIARLLTDCEAQMEALQFCKAAAALRALWSAGNSYLEEKAPWLEIKTDKEGAALTLRTAMNLIHLYAVISEPLIPASAHAMRHAFTLEGDTASWVTAEQATALDVMPAGTTSTVPPVLFAKISEEDLESYKEHFGGDKVA